MNRDTIIQHLAQSHVEFILVHPFRDGNGRLSRLLMDIIAIEAGFESMDYQLWEDNKGFYFKSIQAGIAGNYQYI